MLSTKLKNLKQSRGFTIVELLIVIIVIAILATLVITAYNGVQAKARDVKRQSDAKDIQKAAEAYKADNEGYPTATANFSASGNTIKLDSDIIDNFGTVNSSNKDNYEVQTCNTGDGLIIKYYKEQAPDAGTKVINLGDVSGTGTCSAIS